MSLTAWSNGLVGISYTAFAFWLLQLGFCHSPREASKSTLWMAMASSALWGWLGLMFMLTGHPFLRGLSTLFDLLRYGFLYAFFLCLLKSSSVKNFHINMTWMTWVAAGLVIFSMFALVLSLPVIRLTGWGDQWDISKYILLSSMALPVFAMVLLEQVFQNISEDFLWNIKPLCLGLAGIFLFDLYVYSQAVLFHRLDGDALSIRGVVHALMVPLVWLSITRRSDWVSKIRISPKAAFHSVSLLMAGIYLIFIASVGYYMRYFGGEWGRALQVGLAFLAVLALVLLAVSGALRAKLRVFLGKHFFRYRFDYREEWLKFTRTLSAQNSPQEMGQQVIRGLADMLESPAGGLWMKTQDATQFFQAARWNMRQTHEKEDVSSSLCQFMSSSGWVINLEEYRSYSRRYGTLTLPAWLQNLPQAWLLIPLTVGSELIGFCVLASARTRIDVNWEVNDLLRTAGQQAASYLAQMQATEALLEGRKFEAFNRMSAFVVHDLKNIVTQLSLMLNNAKRLGHNPEFQKDMLSTVENSLERMRQLMLQLRAGATPTDAILGVNLSRIVQRIASVSTGRGRRLEVDVPESVIARGHEERLERIIGHVVQNAFDATTPGDRVWLNLDHSNGQARIVVGDTGHGMSQDFVRHRLFKPFQTTKLAGMGIGAYESFQYVQELGGRIEVDSELGHGTTVTILLPLFQIPKDSDLHVSLELA